MSPDNDTPLCLATVDEIVDELDRRYAASIVAISNREEKTGQFVYHNWRGNSWTCLGLCQTLTKQVFEWCERGRPAGESEET